MLSKDIHILQVYLTKCYPRISTFHILYSYIVTVCVGDDYSSDIEVPESSDKYISGVQPVSSIKSIENAQTVKRIEPVVNVQELARAEEIKSIEPITGMQEVLSMTPITSKQEVKDMKEIKSIQEIANLIPLDSEKAKMFIKQEGLDGSPVVGYSGKSDGEDYSSDPLLNLPAEPKLPAVTPVAAPRGYSEKAPVSAAAQPYSGKPEGLLEPIERDIEKEDKINKLLDDEYSRGLARLKGIEQVKAKHKLARAERIKKLGEVKRMLEVKSMEEVRQMNGIKSINEVKSMQEVKSKKEVLRKHEVKSQQEVLSKVRLSLR